MINKQHLKREISELLNLPCVRIQQNLVVIDFHCRNHVGVEHLLAARCPTDVFIEQHEQMKAEIDLAFKVKFALLDAIRYRYSEDGK